jgi:hypothetical protein
VNTWTDSEGYARQAAKVERPLPPWWAYDTERPPEVDLGDVELPAVPANDSEAK